MDAISDSEMQYSKACAQEVWSTGMCLAILIAPIHSQSVQIESDTHAAWLPTNLRNPCGAETHWPLESYAKEE